MANPADSVCRSSSLLGREEIDALPVRWPSKAVEWSVSTAWEGHRTHLRDQFLSHALLIIAVVGLSGSLAIAEDDGEESICADAMRGHIEYLASPEREGRQRWGKIESRDYIIAHFRESGLQPLFPEGDWLQWLPNRAGDDAVDPFEGQNIGGFVEGTDPALKSEWIVVNAHYDHLGVYRGEVFPGADDNASGVAMLLEVAKRIAEKPLRRSVAFIAFDQEEDLLWGSRWYVAHPHVPLEQIKLCVTADMIGRSLGGLDSPTVFVLGAEHSKAVRQAVDSACLPASLELAQLGIDYIGPRSDYAPFRDQRIPFLFYSTGETPEYHTPEDTVEKIDFQKAALVSTHILSVVRTIGNDDTSPEWSAAKYRNLEEAEAVNRVAARLLTADDEGTFSLSNPQRFFISQVKSKTRYMLRRNTVTEEERHWMKRATQILMFTTF